MRVSPFNALTGPLYFHLYPQPSQVILITDLVLISLINQHSTKKQVSRAVQSATRNPEIVGCGAVQWELYCCSYEREMRAETAVSELAGVPVGVIGVQVAVCVYMRVRECERALSACVRVCVCPRTQLCA